MASLAPSREATRVVIVDDDKNVAWHLGQALTPEGYEVETYSSAEDALEPLLDRPPDVVLLDLNLPGLSGMDLLERLKPGAPHTQIIMLTGHGSFERAVEATKKGAFAFLAKPADPDQVKIEIRNALERRTLQAEVTTLKSQLAAKDAPPTLLGSSKSLQELSATVRKIAPFDVSVLILGESGTGKEVVARTLHHLSPRAGGPFVAVDCGALPDHLVESELFGYEKGAFTGALSAKPGRFQMAHKGTLFLDEVGNLPPAMQVKLLRVLQERSLTRLGGRAEERVDVRIVAATNATLEVAIRQGRFREDLYHRLNEFKVTIAPLRERRGDLPVLARHFAEQYAKEFGKRIESISEEALDVLRRYAFPGNVRELQNVVRHAVILCDRIVQLADLPEDVCAAAKQGGGTSPKSTAPGGVDRSDLGLDLRASLDGLEKQKIEEALGATGWHQEKAAKLLGVTAKTLSAKMRQHNLRKAKG